MRGVRRREGWGILGLAGLTGLAGLAGLAAAGLLLFGGCDEGKDKSRLALSTLHIEEFVYDGFGNSDLYITVVREPRMVLEGGGAVFSTSKSGSFPVTLNNIIWPYKEDDDNYLWLAAVADGNNNGQVDDTDLFMPMLRLEIAPGGVTTLEKVEFVNQPYYGAGGSDMAAGYYTMDDPTPDRIEVVLRLDNRLPSYPVDPKNPIGLRVSHYSDLTANTWESGSYLDILYRVYSPQVSAVFVKTPEVPVDWPGAYAAAFYDSNRTISANGGESGEYTSGDVMNLSSFSGPDLTLTLSLDFVWP